MNYNIFKLFTNSKFIINDEFMSGKKIQRKNNFSLFNIPKNENLYETIFCKNKKSVNNFLYADIYLKNILQEDNVDKEGDIIVKEIIEDIVISIMSQIEDKKIVEEVIEDIIKSIVSQREIKKIAQEIVQDIVNDVFNTIEKQLYNVDLSLHLEKFIIEKYINNLSKKEEKNNWILI